MQKQLLKSRAYLLSCELRETDLVFGRAHGARPTGQSQPAPVGMRSLHPLILGSKPRSHGTAGSPGRRQRQRRPRGGVLAADCHSCGSRDSTPHGPSRTVPYSQKPEARPAWPRPASASALPRPRLQFGSQPPLPQGSQAPPMPCYSSHALPISPML